MKHIIHRGESNGCFHRAGRDLHANRTTIARVMLTNRGLVERVNDRYCIRSVENLRRYMEEIENIEP